MSQIRGVIRCPVCNELHQIQDMSENTNNAKFYCPKCNIKASDINESKLNEKVSKLKKLY